MAQRPTKIVCRRAFSLIEVVIVVVIMGAVAAIAIPRMSSAASNATAGNVQANVAVIEKAIAFYAAEHNDHSPANDADGAVNPSEAIFVRRLVRTTDADGETVGARVFGPYLTDLPANPYNGRRRIRIDGATAGANTHGWRFNSTTRVVEPDNRVTVSGAVLEAPTKDDTGASAGAPVAVEAEK